MSSAKASGKLCSPRAPCPASVCPTLKMFGGKGGGKGAAAHLDAPDASAAAAAAAAADISRMLPLAGAQVRKDVCLGFRV